VRAFVIILLLTLARAGQAYAEGKAPAYFRADQGTPAGGVLPADLAATNLIRWRTPMDLGQSTPVLAGRRLFLTAAREKERELSTLAVDAESGQVLWRATVVVPSIEEYHPQEGNASVATPATDGERVFVFFGSYGLVCYDLDGNKLWEQRMGPFRDEYGAASSPVVADGRVFVVQDHDLGSFVAAFEAATGKEIWRMERPDAVRSYATPVLWKQGTEEQLLIAGALELAAYDPRNGEKLWWVNGLARIVIPTPVCEGGTIFVTSWSPGGDSGQRIALPRWTEAVAKWDITKDGRLAEAEVDDREVLSRFKRMDLDANGLLDQAEWERHALIFQKARNSTMAIRPTGRGDLTDRAILWQQDRGAPYVASPLLHGDAVWMVKDGGLVSKIDVANGKLLFQERLPFSGKYYSSPVADPEKILFASVNGALTLVSSGAEWRILSTRELREPILATPLLVCQRLYIRTGKAIYCLEAKP
jgi:outer membrane protein assembly factor BamB